jgi:hypothetical protein
MYTLQGLLLILRLYKKSMSIFNCFKSTVKLPCFVYNQCYSYYYYGYYYDNIHRYYHGFHDIHRVLYSYYGILTDLQWPVQRFPNSTCALRGNDYDEVHYDIKVFNQGYSFISYIYIYLLLLALLVTLFRFTRDIIKETRSLSINPFV